MSSSRARQARAKASPTTAEAQNGASLKANLYRSIVTWTHPGWSWSPVVSRVNGVRLRPTAGGVKKR